LDIKAILKTLKLNESTISMVLGALVILVVGLLVVNYFKNLPTGTSLPGGASTENETGKAGQYTVVQGDTLWSIAEAHYGDGFQWTEIAKANNLTNPSQIEVGDSLVLPNSSNDSPTNGNTYTVVRGDNLWNIAVKAYGDGYQWTTIAQANNLTNPNLIHAGNVLSLP
jgi:nucleoid-associated protein YgaU